MVVITESRRNVYYFSNYIYIYSNIFISYIVLSLEKIKI